MSLFCFIDVLNFAGKGYFVPGKKPLFCWRILVLVGLKDFLT